MTRRKVGFWLMLVFAVTGIISSIVAYRSGQQAFGLIDRDFLATASSPGEISFEVETAGTLVLYHNHPNWAPEYKIDVDQHITLLSPNGTPCSFAATDDQSAHRIRQLSSALGYYEALTPGTYRLSITSIEDGPTEIGLAPVTPVTPANIFISLLGSILLISLSFIICITGLVLYLSGKKQPLTKTNTPPSFPPL